MITATLRAHGLKVFIIDDASDEPARSSIAALHAPARKVSRSSASPETRAKAARWEPDCVMPSSAALLMSCK